MLSSPTLSRPLPAWAEYGVTRVWLVALFVIAAGIDVRASDLGLGGPASNPLEILMLAGLALLLADTVIYQRQPYEIVRAGWSSSPFLVGYAMWAVVAGVIGLTKLGISFFVLRNLFPAFMFFFIMSFAQRQVRDVRFLLVVFIASSLPNIALGLSQYVFQGPFPVKLNAASAIKLDIDGSYVTAAVSGLFNHPNGLSIFLLPVFLAASGLFLLRGTRSKAVRMFAAFVAISAAVLLFLTKAKGAWAWGVVGLAVLFAPSVLLRFRRAWVLHVAMLVLGIATVTMVSLEFVSTTKTMATRIRLWESTWYAIQNSGFSALFGSAQFDVWSASAKLSDLQYSNAHNVFLNQVVYFGIPAAVLYIGAFFWAIRRAQEAFSAAEDDQVRQVARICLAVLLAVAGQYFFEPAAEASGLALQCFFFMGMAAAAARMAKA